MKGIVSTNLFRLLHNGAHGAIGSDLIGTEADCGDAKNATLVVVLDNAAASDVRNFSVWTSMASSFATSGTALATVTSDGTKIVAIASDVKDKDSLRAETTSGTALSDLTVSSSVIATLAQDGVYTINCPNISRYLNFQYDSSGTGGRMAVVAIAHDGTLPWPGAKSAYS